ncbi:Bug family tripartite tricarboxylate transporter substrate binding protein [Allopusillimonas ginsengisoli]|uniref:Bug family tripartite tricarboxylate transporter substrate binding protein n=1 Tax=Allopusillimonas ginsengisoli TaxID=453575 RepID=UPI00101E9AB7|nr:tripartite tricarboxylate transporter substrate binding protein [Allopusillimonas ginsengisoli]TEA78804.1 tripartite tricarboxylate transporter substrate binding protein [Allopusillimonas ginsengisoli]
MKLLLIAVVLLTFGLYKPSLAQTYPSKPVKILVGFSPGGTVDAVGRAMAASLSKSLGQSFVVENKAGAGGMIALVEAANSAPDGYVLAVGSSGPLTVAPHIYREKNFNSLEKFDPIIWFVSTPGVIVTKNELPVASVDELVAFSKSRPGEITMGSAGVGSMPHMMGEFFQISEGLKWNHVPYRGSPPALTDLAAGRVDVMIDVMPAPVSFLTGNKMKALAVTSKHRSNLLPDVPTLGELGHTGYDMGSWMGLVAPKGTPREIIDKLNTALNSALNTEEVMESLLMIGDPAGGTPEDFTKHIASESKRWSEIITAQNITAN